MSKQTSVEWLHKQWLKGVQDGSVQFLGSKVVVPKEWLQKAKAMNKVEVVDAYYYDECNGDYTDGSEYYDNIYGKRKKVSTKERPKAKK